MYTIAGVPLGQSPFLEDNEEDIATAMGHCCHLLVLISLHLDIPLLYPVVAMGSRSIITNPFASTAADAKFPLYTKGVDPTRFRIGAVLLNNNLFQVLNSAGRHVFSLVHPALFRNILANLNAFYVYAASVAQKPFW